MGIRVQCDWCRETIAAGEPYVTVQLDGKIGNKDIDEPARVFCGNECGRRLVALLDGNPDGRVDMGMEWKLLPVGGEAVVEDDAPQTVPADADLCGFTDTLSATHRVRTSRALTRAGIRTLDQVAEMTDDELMRIEGIGWGLRTKLRRYIEARDQARSPDSPRTEGVESIERQSLEDNLDCLKIWREGRPHYPCEDFVDIFPSTNGSYYGGMREAGIETVGDLRLAIRDHRLLAIRGIGPWALKTIELRLEQLIAQVVAP